MKNLAYILLLLSFNVCAVSPEGEKFCQAWVQDAVQGVEKKNQGVDHSRLEKLINKIPDDVFSQERKLMAKSAVRWVYYFELNKEEAENLGYVRCTSCVDEANKNECIEDFDKNVEAYISDKAENDNF
jgi:hypothetical protein